MDGVSTAISLFSSGYTAFKKVREMRKTIKDAPDQLKSLERSCAFTEQLLDNLKTTSSRLPSDIDLRHLHYHNHNMLLLRNQKLKLEWMKINPNSALVLSHWKKKRPQSKMPQACTMPDLCAHHFTVLDRIVPP